jgi:Cu/Ag efflux protein CusF
MSEDEEYPERGYNTADVEAQRSSQPPKKSFVRRHWGKFLIAAIVAVPALGMTLWTAIAMAFAYSSGERVGYIQKFSEKGWLCKTYEGEIAMVNLPGQIANTFQFTVRDDSVASLINAAQGKRVALSYEQHKGLPTSCFGETEYFVKGVRVVGP